MPRRSLGAGMPTSAATSFTIAWLRASVATPDGSLASVVNGVPAGESGWPR